MAIKFVRKSSRDEYVKREIKILNDLKNVEFVVQLYDVKVS